jgi:chromosome segregation ATPase
MDDSEITTDEEGNVKASPSSPRMKKMPDTSSLETSDTEKPKKLIKRGSIKSKGKSKKRKEEEKPKSAFDYTQEEHVPKTPKTNEPFEVQESSSNNQDLLTEVKDLRNKIRSLESEKRALKENSIKLKQDCSEQIHRALSATGSDDKKVEILQQNLSELETKRDKLELKLSKKDNEIEKINRKLEDKDIDIKNMNEKRKDQQLKIVQAEDKVKQMAVEMKNFREQLGNYEQENVGLKKEINTMNISYNRLKDENQELNSVVDKMRQQIESKRNSFNNNLSTDDSEFDEYKLATETLITDYKAQIRDFEKKMDDLNNDYDNV